MILIATPTRDTVTAGFTGDLVKLCRRNPHARFLAAIGIYLPNLRQSCASTALQIGASHLLFLDSDMRFPEDTLDALLAHDCAIVAANYVQRTMPEWWTARNARGWVSSAGRTGLEQVESIGLGAALIRTDVFARLEPPWFDTPYDGTTHVGEDISFCRHARAAGFAITIDHDLSQRVRHQGAVEYGIEYGVTSCEVEALA